MWISEQNTLFYSCFLEWHSRGQRFDPAYLHQKLGKSKKNLEITWFQGFFFSKSGEIAVFAICACALDFWWKFWKSRGQVLWRKSSWIAPPPWRKPLPTFSLPAKQRGLRTRLCKAMNSSSDPLMKWSNRMSFWIFAIFEPPFFIISNWKVWFS